LANHGNDMPPIEAIRGLNSGIIAVDASDLFESAVLTEGNMEIKVANYLPLGLENVLLQLANGSLGTPIVDDFFQMIPAGDSVQRNYGLDNKEVESELTAEMKNLDIQGSGGQSVPIDTNDYVEVTITIKDLKASEATAVFPNQTVSEQTEDLVYEFSEDLSDIELEKVRVRSGFIRAEIVSTIEDTIKFEYTLPTVTKNGQSPIIKRKVAPPPPGESASFVELFDLAGYEMDLTKNGLTVNTLEQSYKIDLVYSGKLVRIDLQDSVYALFQLIDIIPDYVQGYLGQGSLDITGTERLSIFKDGEINSLNFEEATASISFINSIGMDIQGKLYSLNGFNNERGRSVELSSLIFATPIDIPGPRFPNVGTSITSTISLNHKNSNLRELVNLLPDEIFYDMEIKYNPSGKIGVANFAEFDSEIITYLDLELPVYLKAETFVISDTAAVNFGEANLDAIEGGSLKLIFENEFPLIATVYANLYDRSGRLISMMIDGQQIAAAEVNSAGRVEIPMTSTLEKSFDKDLLDDMINNSYQLVLGYRIATASEPVRLYEDYEVKAKLIAEFKYGL